MKDVLRGYSLGTNPALGESDVLWHLRIQMVTDHQHVQMLGDGVDGKRSRRICGRRQDVRKGGDPNDIRSMPSARAFGMVSVNRPSGYCRDRVLDESSFVDGVGVDGNLNVELAGNFKASVDGRRRRAPIFVELQATGPGSY